jgi:predicted CXXCH cytochrome family protein
VKNAISTLLAAAVLAVAFPAFGQAPPDKVTLKAKDGDVAFDHKLHQKQGCKNCHGAGKPAKITLEKDTAHKLCLDCHKEKAKGPADEKKCDACHKK